MPNLNWCSRRSFLACVAASLVFPIRISSGSEKKKNDAQKDPIAGAAPFVKPKIKWGANHFYEFLNALPDEAILSLMKGLEMVDEKATVKVLNGRRKDVRDIQKQVLWISSNIFAYPFRDETRQKYHDLVGWAAKSLGVKEKTVKSSTTFELERECQMQLFAELWDKLTPEQRIELLQKIEKEGKGNFKDKAAIAALGGAAALGVLSTTVAFTGFAFYTTMSITISTVAGFFGLTLPFAAYAGASSLVAFLSGPVGWAIMGLAAIGGIALAGRANPKKAAAFVCQIHSLKVAALLAAGTPEQDVFD